jgi:multidrug efflux pump subunit AcrB
VALLLSILVAFSINPWISYLMAKDITEEDKKHKVKKKSKYDIRIFYVKIMNFFINAKPNF